MWQFLRPGSPIAIADHLKDMRFPDAWAGSLRQVSDKFAASGKAIFFPVEKHDHHAADIVPSDQSCTFEADRDCAGIVVGPGRAGHGIIARPKQKERSVRRTAGSHHNVVEVALKEGL